MTDLTPRQPQRPLLWPDMVHDLKDILEDDGPPLYIVGGAVRDARRHYPITELDLATPGDATAIARQIANSMDGDVFVLDSERDVARVLLTLTDMHLGEHLVVIDVARYRADDLLADLQDRDFTLNAMAVDLRGDLSLLIDPLNGEDDLRNRIVRRCSPQSIANDPLRALRAVRISAQLTARIEPQTLNDLRGVDLGVVSAERVRDELFKMLRLENPSTALRVAGVLGLLDTVIPEISLLRERAPESPDVANRWDQSLLTVEKMTGILNTISTKRSPETAARFELGMVVMALDRRRREMLLHIGTKWPEERHHGALLLLGALLHLVGPEQAGERAASLRLSNDERKRLHGMIGDYPVVLDFPDKPTDLEMHRFWYSRGAVGVDACLLAMAHYLSGAGTQIDQDVWIRLLEKIETLLAAYFVRHDEVVSPPSLVDGNILMKTFGLQPGKKIGDLLDIIREGQVTGEIRSVEDALNLARKHISANGNGKA